MPEGPRQIRLDRANTHKSRASRDGASAHPRLGGIEIRFASTARPRRGKHDGTRSRRRSSARTNSNGLSPTFLRVVRQLSARHPRAHHRALTIPHSPLVYLWLMPYLGVAARGLAAGAVVALGVHRGASWRTFIGGDQSQASALRRHGSQNLPLRPTGPLRLQTYPWPALSSTHAARVSTAEALRSLNVSCA